jgi:transcriptional regulator
MEPGTNPLTEGKAYPMYIPASFQETRLEVMHELIREHPLGLLITAGAGGLKASPMPFLIVPDEGGNGILRAHLARANPHWKELAGLGESECLVVFQGEQGYVTPSWYPAKAATHKVVPTWNYATVHAWGKPAIIEDADWLRKQLEQLTYGQEASRPSPWAVSDAPDDYIATQMKAIVGLEIPVTRIEGKWKMSQNKDEADRQGVIDGLRDECDPHRNAAMADVVAGRVNT